VIPIRDDNPTRRLPVVTLVIIGLNILAFLALEPVFGTEQEQNEFFVCRALIPYEVVHQENLVEAGSQVPPEGRPVQAVEAGSCPEKSWLLSVFTSMFLHAGWFHLAGNLLFLWVFGNNVEDKLGPILYPLFYLAAGIAATIAQVAVSGGSDAFVPNLGASGAIAGVLGAYAVMFPRRRVLTLIFFFFITWIYLPALVVLGIWFLLQLFSGVGSLGDKVGTGGGVAFFAHIGGFVFGALLALLFFPKERLGLEPPPPRPDASGGWRRRRRERGVGG
jgi:membrane associated rhomboid family serine protease